LGWLVDSQSMVGHAGFLLGIVAAVMAIVIAYAPHGNLSTLTLTLFALSLVVFLVSAEKFTESIDLRDRGRHSAAILLYNLGVVLMLWGLGMLMLDFDYLAPMGVLMLFSLYWVREVIQTVRIRLGARGNRETTQGSRMGAPQTAS
jgi:hypothetical protein